MHKDTKDIRKNEIVHVNDSKKLMSVNQFFFPIEKGRHFFLIVVNTQEKKVEFWDTIKNLVGYYNDEFKKVVTFLDTYLHPQQSFSLYTMNVADIPRQKNLDDCGVFVCYYLEFPEDIHKFRKEKWISEEERCQLCLRILKSTENQKRKHTYQCAERWFKGKKSAPTTDPISLETSQIEGVTADFSEMSISPKKPDAGSTDGLIDHLTEMLISPPKPDAGSSVNLVYTRKQRKFKGNKERQHGFSTQKEQNKAIKAIKSANLMPNKHTLTAAKMGDSQPPQAEEANGSSSTIPPEAENGSATGQPRMLPRSAATLTCQLHLAVDVNEIAQSEIAQILTNPSTDLCDEAHQKASSLEEKLTKQKDPKEEKQHVKRRKLQTTISKFCELTTKDRKSGNKCHQCKKNNRKTVVACTRCQQKSYCIQCINEWYPQLQEDIANMCPFCRGNCNCNECLQSRIKIPDINFIDDVKMQHLHYLLTSLLPVVKHISKEQTDELSIEADAQGVPVSSIKVKQGNSYTEERIYW